MAGTYTQTFLITLHSTVLGDLSTSNICHLLDTKFPYGIWRSEVKEFVPDNYRTMGKIEAIKAVRSALGVGLVEAKLLVDTAESKDTCKWMNVTITYNGTGAFTVIVDK